MAEINISEIKKLFYNLNEEVGLIDTMLSRMRSAVTMAECTVIEIHNLIHDGDSNGTKSETDDDIMY